MRNGFSTLLTEIAEKSYVRLSMTGLQVAAQNGMILAKSTSDGLLQVGKQAVSEAAEAIFNPGGTPTTLCNGVYFNLSLSLLQMKEESTPKVPEAKLGLNVCDDDFMADAPTDAEITEMKETSL